MGRPFGARNKRTAEIASVLNRLEGAGKINPERWITALNSIATDEKREPAERIAAIRALAAYRWGLPRAAVDLTTTHEIGESWQAVLLRVVQSPERRAAFEDLERWREQQRRSLPSATVPADDSPDNPS